MAAIATEQKADTRQLKETLHGAKEQAATDQRHIMEASQRGTAERLKESSMANESYQLSEERIAITEAELIGRKALGDAPAKHGLSDHPNDNFQIAPGKFNTSYNGPIVGETENFSIQKINPLSTVRHEKKELPTVPQVGQNVRINYSANVASIRQVPTQEKTRKHTLSL